MKVSEQTRPEGSFLPWLRLLPALQLLPLQTRADVKQLLRTSPLITASVSSEVGDVAAINMTRSSHIQQ